MTKTQKTFKQPQVEQLPMLSCVGTIGTISPAYMKENGNVVVPLKIAALGAGKDQNVWLFFKPEWIKFDFDPDSLTGGYLKGYQQNVAGSKALSLLQAFAGSDEGFSELCSALDDISADPQTDPETYCESVTQVLTDFVQQNKPMVGYVLSQKLDEDKKRTSWYEINRFWYPTEENQKKERKLAEKKSEKISAAWDKIKSGNFDTDDDGNRIAVKVPVAYKVTFDEDSIPF